MRWKVLVYYTVKMFVTVNIATPMDELCGEARFRATRVDDGVSVDFFSYFELKEEDSIEEEIVNGRI